MSESLRTFIWRPADVRYPKTFYWMGVLALSSIYDFVAKREVNPAIGALLVGTLLAIGAGFAFPRLSGVSKLRIAMLPLAVVFTLGVVFDDRDILRAIWLFSAVLWWGMILVPFVFRSRIDLTSSSVVMSLSVIAMSLGLRREVAYRDIDEVERYSPPQNGARLGLKVKSKGSTVRLCVSAEGAPVLAEELETRIETSRVHC
jgi:hypothetical protein